MTKNKTFMLTWKSHDMHMHPLFSAYREDDMFCDVSLACGGKLIRAHRVILSACSSHFESILRNKSINNKELVIWLGDYGYEHVSSIIEFIYKGSTQVRQNEFGNIMKIARELRIKGIIHDLGEIVPAPPKYEPSDLSHDLDICVGASSAGQPKVHQREPQLDSDAGVVELLSSVNGNVVASESAKRKRGRPRKQFRQMMNLSLPIKLEVDPDAVPNGRHISAPVQQREQAARPVGQWSKPEPKQRVIAKPALLRPKPEPVDFDLDSAASSGDEYTSSGDKKSRKRKPSPDYLPPSHLLTVTGRPRADHSANRSGLDLSGSLDRSTLQVSLTERELDDWADVVKLDEYSLYNDRQSYWDEPIVVNLMKAVQAKEIEMKKAAHLMGVSYSKLYSRYRETFGTLTKTYRDYA